MSKIKDISDTRFGLLVVRRFSHIGQGRHSYWECICDCGTTKIVSSHSLHAGNSKSCGCLVYRTNSLPYGYASMNVLWRTYSKNAKRRGLDFEIGMEEFRRLTSLNCFYCGTPPNRTVSLGKDKKHNGEYVYNGLDRIDNEIGYIIENIVPCCSKCNYAKRDMSYTKFKEWIMDVSDNLAAKSRSFQVVGNSG